MIHYLFGPTTSTFTAQNLEQSVQSGACIPFGPPDAGAGLLPLGPADNWESVCTRLPEGWRPDVVLLNLAYNVVPAFIWTISVPLVAIAGDAQLLWGFRRK